MKFLFVMIPTLFLGCANPTPIPCDACGTEETKALALKACEELEDEDAQTYCKLGVIAARSQCLKRCE